ncbi:hypothetical protein PGQ11_006132 [Apiospora arundinis]|uniref:Uncharacterized protein n=1 Tax=Apiospora arundinis TaxID=335852 RepID=A0ABR2IRS9_9PEZI
MELMFPADTNIVARVLPGGKLRIALTACSSHREYKSSDGKLGFAATANFVRPSSSTDVDERARAEVYWSDCPTCLRRSPRQVDIGSTHRMPVM